ncbi:MAG: pseudouridine-5'-phosphate glycosidase [Saccharofermentanales bacterium]
MIAAFPLKISAPVKHALSAKRAVLALESTVVTHGLPYPSNFEALETLEYVAREEGAVPATIALINGVCCVGLDAADKSYLAEQFRSEKSQDIKKIAIRDLALAVIKGYTGGTTVSATMYLAHQAGLKVFSTGGIGGVHRGWQGTLDISSDLDALAKIPIVVVCAGSKAILDIAATLEVLESRSVPVLGWQTDEYPTFYSRRSGIKIPRVGHAAEVADILRLSQNAGALKTGLLLANPIPLQDEIPVSEIEPFIQSAVADARKRGISGKELTPFLLSALAESTLGRSIEANLALLKNNLRLGALIAKEMI